jgi:type IV pilus assembly protein PilE
MPVDMLSNKQGSSAVGVVCLRRRAGFSLIELMIVLAVIAILTAIAYPSYQRYVLKGQRAEGRAALVNLLQQQEAYITQNGTYLTFAAGAGSVPFRTASNDNADVTTAAYRLGAQNCPGAAASSTPNDCVQVFATPNRADPAVGDLTINSNGQKSCSGTDQTLCW